MTLKRPVFKLNKHSWKDTKARSRCNVTSLLSSKSREVSGKERFKSRSSQKLKRHVRRLQRKLNKNMLPSFKKKSKKGSRLLSGKSKDCRKKMILYLLQFHNALVLNGLRLDLPLFQAIGMSLRLRMLLMLKDNSSSSNNRSRTIKCSNLCK